MPIPKPFKKGKKETIFSNVAGLETKENEHGDLIVKGYIATTHLDDGFLDNSRGVYVKDKIVKQTLDSWASEINEGNPRTNKVSFHHNIEPQPVGVGIKGSASVDRLPDGEYGLYVETFIDKTLDSFEDISYKIDKGIVDAFSIEFRTREPSTSEYIPGAVHEEMVDGGVVRTLLPETVLSGWTLASRPMNEQAIMIKEIMNFRKEEENKNKIMEDSEKMTEEVKKPEEVPNPEDIPKEIQLKPVEKKQEEVEEKKPEEESEDEGLKEFRAYKRKLEKDRGITEMKEQVKEELKLLLAKEPVEEKVQKNTDTTEIKEFTEYKEIFSPESKLSIGEQFKLAGRFAEAKGLFKDIRNISTSVALSRNYEIKMTGIRGENIEYKGLGITTNQGTDYYLSAAELNDIFDPVIYNAMNQTTLTWNLLAKDDFSNKGNNLIQFTLKTAANPTAGAYAGNAVSVGNVTREKYATKFKKYQVGVEIDGDMIAAGRGGPIGDLFAQEIADSTDDLMAVINLALFAEVGLETATGVIGFEYLSDSAGNTTLYGKTRGTANYLAPAAAANTYVDGASANLSITNLRAAKRNAIEEGAKMENLVWIGSPIQGDKLRGIYDAAQRLTPTSSRFGFEGMMSFDGIPFFEDKDCADDDVWLLDLETHRVAIWVPPTLEMLGKDSDSVKGFVKTYFAIYNRAPRRIVQIYSNKTT